MPNRMYGLQTRKRRFLSSRGAARLPDSSPNARMRSGGEAGAGSVDETMGGTRPGVALGIKAGEMVHVDDMTDDRII
jgi:hypothetical protein